MQQQAQITNRLQVTYGTEFAVVEFRGGSMPFRDQAKLLRRAASVVWAKHPSYGFVFDQPLSEAEFASADTVSNVAPLAIRSSLEMSAQLAATGRLDPAARPERMGMAKSLAMATAGVLIAVGEGLRKRAK